MLCGEWDVPVGSGCGCHPLPTSWLHSVSPLRLRVAPILQMRKLSPRKMGCLVLCSLSVYMSGFGVRGWLGLSIPSGWPVSWGRLWLSLDDLSSRVGSWGREEPGGQTGFKIALSL